MIYDKNRGIIYIIDTITEENMFIDYPKFQHTKRRLYPIVGFFTNNGQRLKPRGNIMECSFKKKAMAGETGRGHNQCRKLN